MRAILTFCFIIVGVAASSLHEAISRDDTTGVLALLLGEGEFLSNGEDGVNVKNDKDQSALQVAVHISDYDACEYLIKKGADVHVVDKISRTSLLHHATSANNLGLVNLLLQHEVDVNRRTISGKTALHFAAELGFAEVFKALMLNSGGRVKVRSICNKRYTTIHYAAKGGSVEIIELLGFTETVIGAKEAEKDMTALHLAIQTGHKEAAFTLLNFIDVASIDKFGMTSGHYAASYGHKNVLITLAAKNGHILEKKDAYGNTVLLSAVSYPENVKDDVCAEIVKCLILLKADVNAFNIAGKNAAHIALENENLAAHGVISREIMIQSSEKMAKALLPAIHYDVIANAPLAEIRDKIKTSKDINEGDHLDRTAVHLAAEYDNAEVIQELILSGCDLTAQNSLGNTALHLARSVEIVRALLIANPNLANIANFEGNIPLYDFVEMQREDLVKIITPATTDLDVYNAMNENSLNLATKLENAPMVECLLRHGAGKKSNNFNEPLHYAADKANLPLVKLLIAYGQDVTGCNFAGVIPAHFAAECCDDVELMRTLLRGVQPDATDIFGYSLLHYAAIFKNTGGKVAEMLVEYGVPIDSKTYLGKTAIHLAIKWGNVAVVDVLIRCGANLTLTTPSGRTALHAAVSRTFSGQNADTGKIVSALVRADRNLLKVKDSVQLTPVHDLALLLISHSYDHRAKMVIMALELTAADIGEHISKINVILKSISKSFFDYTFALQEPVKYEDYVKRAVDDFKKDNGLGEKSTLEENVSEGLGNFYAYAAQKYPSLASLEFLEREVERYDRKVGEYRKEVEVFENSRRKAAYMKELRFMLMESFMSLEGRKRFKGTYMDSSCSELVDDILIGVTNNGDVWGRMELVANSMILTLNGKEMSVPEYDYLFRIMAEMSEFVVPMNRFFKRKSTP